MAEGRRRIVSKNNVQTKRKKKFMKESDAKPEPDEQPPMSKVVDKVPERDKYDKTEKTFKLDLRMQWCQKTMEKKPNEIMKEFVAHKMFKPAKYTTELWEKNEPKNRYDDIYCMDATRVVLKDRPRDDDYIHASWIDCLPDGQKYICTQGPITSTIVDFWHMIFTEKSPVVVMLTALEDNNAESKCSPYFPTNKSEPFNSGPYKISIKSVEKDPFPTIKYNVLRLEKGGQAMDVHHIIYDTWADHLAPENPAPCVGVFKMSKRLAAGQVITVHCSAGIGRTSTFVGIDYASQRIAKEGENFKMIDVVKNLRHYRLHSIQSHTQYLFLAMCLLQFFLEENVIKKDQAFDNFMENAVGRLKKIAKSMAAAKIRKE